MSKLVIHIGTQKTGTTVIQNFLSRNKEILQKNGILYPLFGPAIVNHNRLAVLIYNNELKNARKFVDTIVRKKNVCKPNIVLLSAESFYAMTATFKFRKHKNTSTYVENEKQHVRKLKKLLGEFNTIEIHCFLRRQDLFLESFYSQKIKKSTLDCDINEFAKMAQLQLDYKMHIELWADIFGRDNIYVHSYDKNNRNITFYFIQNILGLENETEFHSISQPLNKSFSKEFIQFKRILNRSGMSKVENLISTRTLRKVSNNLSSDPINTGYMSYKDRLDLIKKYEDDNKYIEDNYLFNNKKLFQDIIDSEPGFSDELYNERMIMIIILYDYYYNRPSLKLTLNLRRLVRNLIRSIPVLNRLLYPLRNLVYQHYYNVRKDSL